MAKRRRRRITGFVVRVVQWGNKVGIVETHYNLGGFSTHTYSWRSPDQGRISLASVKRAQRAQLQLLD